MAADQNKLCNFEWPGQLMQNFICSYLNALDAGESHGVTNYLEHRCRDQGPGFCEMKTRYYWMGIAKKSRLAENLAIFGNQSLFFQPRGPSVTHGCGSPRLRQSKMVCSSSHFGNLGRCAILIRAGK